MHNFGLTKGESFMRISSLFAHMFIRMSVLGLFILLLAACGGLNTIHTNNGTPAQRKTKSISTRPIGTTTEFPLPPSVSHPGPMIAGRDGNLWFTEVPENVIERVTPTGIITEFTISTSSANAIGNLTAGPDGNLWFTKSGADGNKVGRITPTGTITEFAILTPCEASGMVAGPDGNLWFTEICADTHMIERVTPTGTITEFTISTSSDGKAPAWRGDRPSYSSTSLYLGGNKGEYASDPPPIAQGIEFFRIT